jgi:hypothetical protein
VVTQTGRGIAELIHRPVHRVNLSGLEWLLDGHVVAQRIALDRVTGIEEQRVLYLGARLLDQRGRAREPERGVALIAIVVVVDDVRVDVGRRQEA